MPNGRCRIHGGKSLKGIEHPDYKDGKKSKYNPVNIAKRYEKALQDPNLLSIKHDIAKTQAMLEDTWDKLDNAPDAAKSWDQISAIINDMADAFATGSADAIMEARHSIPKAQGIIARNRRFHEAKKDIQVTLDQKRKQLATKAQIEAAEDKSMSYDQALLFMRTVFLLIANHVTSPEEKQVITLKLQEYVGTIESLP